MGSEEAAEPNVSQREEAEPERIARMSTFGRFHDVARGHLGLLNTIAAELPPMPPYSGEVDGPQLEAWELWKLQHAELESQLDEHATITIIFACAACELYINDAAVRLLGDAYFENHIGRIDLLSKWIVVPRLICGHKIDRGGAVCSLLKSLVQ